MRDISSEYTPIQLLTPTLATATRTGTGQLFTPANSSDGDAVAIVHLGAVDGTPDTTSLIVTIEQSATLNGTYTVTKTFPTATAGAQIGSAQVKLDTAKPYVRAVATIAFSGGSTPSIAVGVSLLVRQTVKKSGNVATLA